MHTGNVSFMDTQTTTLLIGFAGFVVAQFTYLATMKRDLRTEIADRFATERTHNDSKFDVIDSKFDAIDARFDSVDQRIAELRADMKQGFASVEIRLGTLEQRTYDLGRQRDVS